MNIAARVEWADGDERRAGHARHKIHLLSRIATKAGEMSDARIINISRTGLLLETEHPIAIGDDFLVEIADSADCPATVIWASGDLYGCQFETPLTKAGVNAALLRSTPVAPNENDMGSARAAVSEQSIAIPPESFSARLTRLRKSRGLTQGELAGEVGVSKTTVWNWENGKAGPRKSVLSLLAFALGVPVEEFSAEDLGNSEPENEIAAKTEPELQRVVQTSKYEIARAAGTSAEKVTISIDM